MKKLVVFILCVLSFFACKRGEEENARNILVKACLIRKEIINEKIYAIGTVSYIAKASVTSKVMGEVQKVMVDVGSVIKAGALLLQIDTFPMELEMKKARAELESAEAALQLSEAKYTEACRRVEQQVKVIEKTEADLSVKRSELDNMKRVVERKKQLIEIGAITQEEYENILTDLKNYETRVSVAEKELEIQKNGYSESDLADAGSNPLDDPHARMSLLKKMNTTVDKADVDMQKARVKNARAEIESTQLLIDRSSIRAPISGIVAARNIEPGERVVNEEPLLVLMNIDDIYAVMNITANDACRVRRDNRLQIFADAVPDKDYSGSVSHISPVVDLKTGVIEIKGRVSNPGYLLKPGMFLRGYVFTGKKKESVCIPTTALVTSQSNQGRVFVVVKSNEIYLRDIRFAENGADKIEILNGLKTNEVVLVDGTLQFNEGDKVNGLEIIYLP